MRLAEPGARVSRPFTIRTQRFVTVTLLPVTTGAVYNEARVTLSVGPTTSTVTAGVGSGTMGRAYSRVLTALAANHQSISPESSPMRTEMRQSSPLYDATTWYKIAVDQSGFCRVTGAQLRAAGLNLSSVDPSQIRLFNGGGLELAMRNEQPRPTFREVTIQVIGGGDGSFDDADALLFYAEAPSRWTYQAGQQPRYANNPYTATNIYWAAFEGTFTGFPERIQQIDGAPNGTADTLITDCRQYVRLEQERLLAFEGGHFNDYYNWYWTDSSAVTIWARTPAALGAQGADILVSARTGFPYVNLTINGVAANRTLAGTTLCTFTTPPLIDGLNEIRLTQGIQFDNSRPYLNYLDISYPASLTPDNNGLDVVIGPFDGRARLVITDNFSAPPALYLLGDPQRPAQLTGALRQGGTVTLDLTLSSSAVNRVVNSAPGSEIGPVSVTRTQPTNLRDLTDQTDLFIVAPRQFLPALAEYVDYREARGYTITVVSVEDILENFGYGLYDPTAIRDFLKHAYETLPAPAPSAVLFVGDANYDFLDRTGSGVRNLVPAYINPLENVSLGNAYSDDNYVFFGAYGLLDGDTSYTAFGDRGYDMMAARWPVKTAAEIATITRKIKAYESESAPGRWRRIVTLVADDEVNGSSTGELFHTTQTEDLARFHTPRVFTTDKIYLIEYPLVGRFKPAAADAIVRSINEGALLVNYVGHGNPDVWASERVFTRSGDLPRLTNDQLPLVFGASCAIGQYDDPRREAMGEDLLSMEHGAIAVIAAQRLVFSSPNASYNQLVFDYLLYGDSLSICEAVFTAKLLRQYADPVRPRPVDNDRAYVFLGDPLLRLAVPRYDIEFTQSPDSLKALQVTTVGGRIVDDLGQTLTADGTVFVDLYDAERLKSFRKPGLPVLHYTVTGPTLYRGEVRTTAGVFAASFVPPLDMNFGAQAAQLAVYGSAGGTDAVGLLDSIPVSALVPTSADSIGPTITLSLGGRTNLQGVVSIAAGEPLTAVLSDSSGINLASGVAHGIVLEIDERPDQAVDLTDLFSYDVNSYTTGKLVYALSGLDPGEHRLKLRAWDNANNSARVEFAVKLVSDLPLAINDLLNYPNPMEENTTFYFELTQAVARFALEIFTLSGRRIRSFGQGPLGADLYPNGALTVQWDGRDEVGDRVATGVYLYKATAIPESGESVEAFGKIVVVN